MGHTIIPELVSVAVGLGLGALFVWLANGADRRRINQERKEFAARLQVWNEEQLDFLSNASSKEIEAWFEQQDEQRKRRADTFGSQAWRAYP